LSISMNSRSDEMVQKAMKSKKPLVLAFGTTGNGKSTVLNCLLNDSREEGQEYFRTSEGSDGCT